MQRKATGDTGVDKMDLTTQHLAPLLPHAVRENMVVLASEEKPKTFLGAEASSKKLQGAIVSAAPGALSSAFALPFCAVLTQQSGSRCEESLPTQPKVEAVVLAQPKPWARRPAAAISSYHATTPWGETRPSLQANSSWRSVSVATAVSVFCTCATCFSTRQSSSEGPSVYRMYMHSHPGRFSIRSAGPHRERC